MSGHIARMRKKDAYKLSMGKSEEKTANVVGVEVKY
jgi:hypothetical protein